MKGESVTSSKPSLTRRRQNKIKRNCSSARRLSGCKPTGEEDLQDLKWKRHARRARREAKRRSEVMKFLTSAPSQPSNISLDVNVQIYKFLLQEVLVKKMEALFQ